MKKIPSILEVLGDVQDKNKQTFNDKYLKSKKQPTSTDDGLVNKSIKDVKDSLREQACPEGEAWCPIHKKCMPADHRPGKGKHFGKGKGPIGNPKQEQKIDDLVDEIFEEGFDKLNQMIRLEKQVDDTLDEIDSKHTKNVVKVKVSPTMQGGVDVSISENKKKVAKKIQNEISVDAAVAAGILGGAAGLTANALICRKRFPDLKTRRVHKIAYAKCLRNPFSGASKKVKENKQCQSLREKIKTYTGFSSKCAFKFKGSPEKIKKCQTEMRRAKQVLVAKKKSLSCL